MITPKTSYKIKGKGRYFKQKYGSCNPVIEIEDLQSKVFGNMMPEDMVANPTCMLYVMRAVEMNLPTDGELYYGKVNGLGEIVHETELEVIV